MTFGQLKAKAVVRDVARVLNFPMAETNRIAAMIPADPASKDTLVQYADKIPELKEAFQSDEQHELLFENCLAIEGTVRRSEEHTSELQSRGHLVCRLLLEKKKQTRPQ